MYEVYVMYQQSGKAFSPNLICLEHESSTGTHMSMLVSSLPCIAPQWS